MVSLEYLVLHDAARRRIAAQSAAWVLSAPGLISLYRHFDAAEGACQPAGKRAGVVVDFGAAEDNATGDAGGNVEFL